MDDLALAQAAARGDRRAGEALVRATQADVWRFAQYLLGPADAPDLVQDTYLRAWRSLPRHPPTNDVRAWLLAITWRASAEHHQRAGRQRRIVRRLRAQPLTTYPAADSGLDQQLLDSLEPHQRAAFVLTQVLGYPYETAAAICNVPIGTIRSRVARARTRLAAEFHQVIAHEP